MFLKGCGAHSSGHEEDAPIDNDVSLEYGTPS
jgi:hypothetical protein